MPKTTSARPSHLGRSAGLFLLVALLMAGALISVSGSNPALAQGTSPTPTPGDPTWRAFRVARDAIEEEFSVDLTYVSNYTFAQTEWTDSIDSCDSDILDVDWREVYFGWTYVITSLSGNQYQARVSFDLRAVTVCDEVSAATAAPVAEGTPDASLPAPVVASGAAGGFELGGHVQGLDTAAVTAMRNSRMTWVKKQVEWRIGDTTGLAASYIQQARANGFRILLGIKGDRNQMANYDQYITQYAQFVGQVAALGADAIEVWNEPNIDREWPTGQVNGATYTRLLAAAYNAIKAANANTIVISGAPAPTGFFGAAGCAAAGCNDDTFMQQMATAGAARYMDCVGLHYNEGIIGPTASSGDPRGNYPTYYFGSMLARGYNPFGGKPVCFTELGYLSPEGFTTPLPGNFAWAADTTVAEHAQWLGQAVSAARASGRVRLLIVWNVNFTRFDTDPMGGYAMIRPGGGCPSCSQLAAAMGG